MSDNGNKIKNTEANEYAVAYSLNELVRETLITIFVAKVYGVDEKLNIDEINRDYILLVNELSKIYGKNTELSAIKSEPFWRNFDRIKHSIDDIHKHMLGQGTVVSAEHCADVERLCIIAGSKEPEYTTELSKLIDRTISTKKQLLEDIENAMDEKQQSEMLKATGEYIFEYTMRYKPDGTISINDVLRLKKAQIDSAIDKLLEQALKSPNTPFKPNLGKTARNISTIISSAGFTPILRDLFFPTVSDEVVVFRPTVSREQVDKENIDTEELDLKLIELGAWTILVRE